MARLTLVLLSTLLTVGATLGVAFALVGRLRSSHSNGRADAPTCPIFELLMQ
jgi:hypothetical protein